MTAPNLWGPGEREALVFGAEFWTVGWLAIRINSDADIGNNRAGPFRVWIIPD